MKHIVLASDGTLNTLIGIKCVLTQLAPLHLAMSAGWKVWIVIPNNSEFNQSILNSLFCGLDFQLVSAPARQDDKYYIQLGITRVFERVGSELVIYLDYDHLVFRPTVLFEMLSQDNIFVSSECKATAIKIEGIDWHVNISIIYGTGDKLKAIGKEWPAAYADLRDQVEQRYLTEYAFALAASRAKVTLKPCSADIQGNFIVSTSNSALFHYGGESERSKTMKQELTRAAITAPLDDPYLAKSIIDHLSRLLLLKADSESS